MRALSRRRPLHPGAPARQRGARDRAEAGVRVVDRAAPDGPEPLPLVRAALSPRDRILRPERLRPRRLPEPLRGEGRDHAGRHAPRLLLLHPRALFLGSLSGVLRPAPRRRARALRGVARRPPLPSLGPRERRPGRPLRRRLRARARSDREALSAGVAGDPSAGGRRVLHARARRGRRPEPMRRSSSSRRSCRTRGWSARSASRTAWGFRSASSASVPSERASNASRARACDSRGGSTPSRCARRTAPAARSSRRTRRTSGSRPWRRWRAAVPSSPSSRRRFRGGRAGNRHPVRPGRRRRPRSGDRRARPARVGSRRGCAVTRRSSTAHATASGWNRS